MTRGGPFQALDWLLAAFRLAQHPTKYIIDWHCPRKKKEAEESWFTSRKNLASLFKIYLFLWCSTAYLFMN